MADWRDRIIADLTTCDARLLLVADPDGLLLDETVQAAIRAHGMAVEAYEDPLHFRVVYEERYRPAIAQQTGGEAGEMRLVVVVRDDAPAGQVKDLLAKYKAAQQARQAKLEKAQDDLKAVLTSKQEAQAYLLGLVR